MIRGMAGSNVDTMTPMTAAIAAANSEKLSKVNIAVLLAGRSVQLMRMSDRRICSMYATRTLYVPLPFRLSMLDLQSVLG